MDGIKLNTAKKLLETFLATNQEKMKAIGVTMCVDRCRYDSKSSIIKLIVLDAVEINGVLADANTVMWHNVAEDHRMEKDWMGKTFTEGRYTYKIVGWNRRARKQPVKLERTFDKKSFKCSVKYLRRYIVPEKVMAEEALNKLQ